MDTTLKCATKAKTNSLFTTRKKVAVKLYYPVSQTTTILTFGCAHMQNVIPVRFGDHLYPSQRVVERVT